MQINNEIYETLGERWYTAFDDPVALLRMESKAKIPWVLEKIRKFYPGTDLKILDVGCGAGFLSNRLAEEKFQVFGVDLSEESLKVARKYDQTSSVSYSHADAYALPFPENSFDVVSAMDFLEHVENPDQVIAEISRVLRPGGLFFYHTFNRNWLAYIVVIKFVEWFVKNTPKQMHILRLFIKPSEVKNSCEAHGLEVKEVTGLRPVISSIRIGSFLRGIVPQGFRFTLTSSLLLSYMGYAQKRGHGL